MTLPPEIDVRPDDYVAPHLRADRIAEKENWLFSDDELRDIALEKERRESINNVLRRDLSEGQERLRIALGMLLGEEPYYAADLQQSIHQALLRVENSLQVLRNEATGEPRGPL